MQRCRCATVFFALAAVPIGGAQAHFRLVGLERLYFEHRGAEQQGVVKAPISAEASEALPSRLSMPDFADPDTPITESDGRLQVVDVAVPWPNARHPRWIRQVSDRNHPRLFEVWWALYDDGRRTDVWHFSAMPARNDRKMLSNYFLQRIARNHDGTLVFEVSGTMFRPGGAWSITRKDFYFNAVDDSLALHRVANTFGFFNAYDEGEGGRTDVRTEREVDGRFEVREIQRFSSDAARECGFRSPEELGDTEKTHMMTAAYCLTQRPEAVVKFRDFATPSFIERAPCSDKGDNRTEETESC